jgi:regulator of sirC expression with transglutaminase-like and TPR domain
MNSPTIVLSSKKPSASQWAALLNLLADDDPAVYQTVRKEILSLGPEAGDELRSHVLSADPVLRRRVREIIRHFEQQDADTKFLGFCLKHGEEFDLEKAAWLFARTEYPDINIDGYRALLDGYAEELRERIHDAADANDILIAINKYLFTDLGFVGDEVNYYDPENSYLNRVIDRRAGNPINLCLLYLLLARRLQLPMTGVGLPGHFICRYQSSSDEIYVDAFNRGQRLSKADCIQYLLNANQSLRDDFLSPLSSRRLLTRNCTNLHKIYLQLKLSSKATRLQRYIVALAR